MMVRRVAASVRPITAVLLAVVSLSTATALDNSPPRGMTINIGKPMYAGRSYEVTCRSVGWKSLPKVTWWLGDQLLTSHRDQITYNAEVLEATLLLTPTRDDNGRPLKCQAEGLQGFLEDSVNLKVYYGPPPTSMIINIDQPLLPGRSYEVTCVSEGWRSSPIITWWLGDQQLLNRTESMTMTPEMLQATTYLTPTKDNDGLLLKCRAEGLQGVIEDSVTLSMHYGPPPPHIVINIVQPLSAGRSCEITCRTWGWQSLPDISWFLGDELLSNNTQQVSYEGNDTVSALLLIPTPDDNGQPLKCRAEAFQGLLDDTVSLNVYFAPILEQQYSYDETIEEGSRVHFGCKVKANPRPYVNTWMYQGRPMEHNPCTGVWALPPGYSTVYNIRRHEVGEYACMAGNVEGETLSPPFRLHIVYKPACRGGTERVFAVPRHVTVSLVCDVDAVPPVEEFRWAFSSGRSSHWRYPSSNFTSQLPDSRSRRSHTPSRDEDYGAFYCWARNSVGEQVEPCVFHVVPLERPRPPTNCSVMNWTPQSVKVNCSEGVGGGRWKKFMLEVFDVTSGQLLYNETWLDPNFLVKHLKPNQCLHLRVTAIAAGDRSETVVLATTTTVEAKVKNDGREKTANCSVLNRTSQSLMMVCLGGFDNRWTQSALSEVFDSTAGRLLTKTVQNHQTVLVQGLDTKQQRRLRMLADSFNGQVAAVMMDFPSSDPKQFTIVEPLSTRILLTEKWLIALKTVMVTCRTVGSQPPAYVTWWLDNQRLFDIAEQISADESETLSTVRLTPQRLNDRSVLTCRAENPYVLSSAQEHSVRLNVLYPPKVTLYIERPLRVDDIREGDNVTLKCQALSNPPIWRVKWLFQDRLLRATNSYERIDLMATLNLGLVTHTHAGDYDCVVSNAAGDTASSTLRLTVKHKPVCRSQHPRVYIVPRHEGVLLECQVDASPQPDGYRWMFNSSMETDGTTMSFLEWTNGGWWRTHKPVNDMDYGTFYCWAFNQLGVQKDPCVFHVAPPGRPNAPSNCSVLDVRAHSFAVQCATATDGGRRQSYQLEVFDILKGNILFNKTQPSPAFRVSGMQPHQPITMRIAAVSPRGRSEWVRLNTFTLPPPPLTTALMTTERPEPQKKTRRIVRPKATCGVVPLEDPCQPIKVPRL